MTGRKNRKITLELCQEIAKSKDGECLSTVYVNNKTPMNWKCNKDQYVWSATADSIVGKNYWCKICYVNSQKNTIEQMQEKAASKGGKCLSTIYIDKSTDLEWQCEKGHIWKSPPECVFAKDCWCGICYIESKRLGIEQMHMEAARRGGKCLSTTYINTRTELEWQCEKRHIWKTAPANIVQSGHWCPDCRKKNETYCRYILESLFWPLKFPNVRPKWIRNESGNKLEIDCLNEVEMRLGLECQGDHHYKVVERYETSEDDLKKQQKHDRIKIEECSKRGIDLIIVPLHIYDKKYKIKKLMVSELNRLGWIVTDEDMENIV